MNTSARTLTGACLCGNVAYQVANVSAGLIEGIICHCRTCQRLHTMVSYNAAFPSDNLTVTKGKPTHWIDTNPDSGFVIHRYFCSTCGSALYSFPESMPDKVFAKAGSLMEIDEVFPSAEIFVERLIHGSTRECSERKTKLFEGMMKKEIS